MAALPARFADLEPFAPWALASEDDRYAKRLSSTMEEMQTFYDAAFPRIQEALDYLDGFDLEAMPEDAQTLLRLFYSLVTVSFCVEAWAQPRVPDSGASMIYAVVEPAI